jgi:CRP-like cAMP-binding protein
MQFEPLPPVPAVTLARHLRQIPLFRFASVDELFRISSISQQVRYEAGSIAQKKGGRASYIQVLLDGAFEIAGGEHGVELVKPPFMIGFHEVLEGTSIKKTAIAASPSVALVMAAEEFRALLSANIELAQGLFRMLLEQKDSGAAPSRTGTPARELSTLPAEALKIVDKVLFLQTVPVLARATADELYALAAITREVSFQQDEVLFSEGQFASLWVMLSGELRLEPPSGDAAISVRPGECLAAKETLAGSDWSWRGRAVIAGRALRVEREALYELLADHMDLLQNIFGAIFKESAAAPTQSLVSNPAS